jgi:hypothetical protein
MIVAFDIDGTLTAEPTVLGQLMKELKKGQNKVFILTSSVNGSPSHVEKIQQLARLKITPDMYDDIHIVHATEPRGQELGKGIFCQQNGVHLLFENEDRYIRKVNCLSPETCCVLMRRFKEEEEKS